MSSQWIDPMPLVSNPLGALDNRRLHPKMSLVGRA